MRRACEVCDGTGRILEEEGKLHTHFCNTRSIRRRALPGVETPNSLERAIGYFLFIALVGYAWFVLFNGHDGVDVWPKIAVAIAASVTLLAVLRRFSAASRPLRWATLAFFLMIVCGGVALEIVRS